mgnify:CR=1 FL=1
MLINKTFRDVCYAMDELWDVLNEVKNWNDDNPIKFGTVGMKDEKWSDIVDAMKNLEEMLEIDRDENGEYYCTEE